MRVPPKLAQRIWRGEFIEMAELLPEKLGQSDEANKKAGEGETRKRKRSRVSNALQWVECFNSYISVVAQQQPARVTDLLGYVSLIVHAARKFKGEGWVQYDRNFRRHAETHPATKWAEANTSLWTLAFCNAQPRPHCDLCFSVDHETAQCDEYDPPEEPVKRKAEGKTQICRNWNRHACTSSTCTFQHICLECHQRHKEKDCPVANWRPSRSQPRSREDRGEKQPFRKKGGPSQ
jgi:hypothetical protein